MSRISRISGPAVVLPGDDIDTDRIIPARFLKCITFDGLGESVFKDEREQDPQHPFNAPQADRGAVLVSGRNFGCGSSREHAPQALLRWGIRAIVAQSFAEIFFGNCIAIGLPCLKATGDDLERLHRALKDAPGAEIEVHLENLHLRHGNLTVPVTIADGPRQMFLGGTWDATAQLLSNIEAIRATAARLAPTGA